MAASSAAPARDQVRSRHADLTGDNTYAGRTTISAGTLQLGNGGTTGSVAGNIVDNAALVFNRSDVLTYGGVISGTGTLTKIGTGTLILTGDQHLYRRHDDQRRHAARSAMAAPPAASPAISSTTRARLQPQQALTYGGVISGTGALTKPAPAR